jgi:hypothetical protein
MNSTNKIKLSIKGITLSGSILTDYVIKLTIYIMFFSSFNKM